MRWDSLQLYEVRFTTTLWGEIYHNSMRWRKEKGNIWYQNFNLKSGSLLFEIRWRLKTNFFSPFRSPFNDLQKLVFYKIGDQSVWPNMARFCYFGKILKYFDIFFILRTIWKIVQPILQIFMQLGKCWLLQMVKYWKNILAIWSHWGHSRNNIELVKISWHLFYNHFRNKYCCHHVNRPKCTACQLLACR